MLGKLAENIENVQLEDITVIKDYFVIFYNLEALCIDVTEMLTSHMFA